MGRSRKRTFPITPTFIKPSSSTSALNTRSVIRRFHVLLKHRSKTENEPGVISRKQKLREIDTEIGQLGGLDAYQHMSKLGQGAGRGGGTEKVLIGWLKDLNVRSKSLDVRLRLLEVGALKPDNYQSCQSWIENFPIDLNSQHPDITEQDFLKMDEDENREKWDMISLSLVLNFVPNTRSRGRMLCLAHTMLKRDGLLFLALPLPCVLNSRYLTLDHLTALMQYIGFSLVKGRWKANGKMAYWLFCKENPQGSFVTGRFDKKTVLKNGNRNNFAIVL